MELGLRKVRDIYIIDVIGELDKRNSPKLSELFSTMLDRKAHRLILNMDAVHSLDSGGVESLDALFSMVREQQVRFCLANVFGPARQTLHESGHLQTVHWEETLDSAIAFVSSI